MPINGSFSISLIMTVPGWGNLKNALIKALTKTIDNEINMYSAEEVERKIGFYNCPGKRFEIHGERLG